MNRRERRIAEKKVRGISSEEREGLAPASLPILPVVGEVKKPGVLLRMMARLLLSTFILKRVRHPEVVDLLADVARQSGRMDALLQIQMKRNALSKHS